MHGFESQLQESFQFQPRISSLSKKSIVLTGATSGIGLALSCQLAKKGAHLFLIARREERLEMLKSFLHKELPGVQVQTLAADVTCPKTFGLLPAHCDILVNNAGLALGRDPGHTANWSDWEQMLDVNVKALARLTHAVLPAMVARKSGHIVSVGSVAGHAAYAGGSMYCASKHAVRAFHEALRQDLCAHNIRLSLVSPGMVETEFSVVRLRGDKQAADDVYKGMRPLSGHEVSAEIVHVLEADSAINIDNILLMPSCQGAATVVARS
jgi:3-hydroxy acid dehydrogenase / malonic semialdehyde reductase